MFYTGLKILINHEKIVYWNTENRKQYYPAWQAMHKLLQNSTSLWKTLRKSSATFQYRTMAFKYNMLTYIHTYIYTQCIYIHIYCNTHTYTHTLTHHTHTHTHLHTNLHTTQTHTYTHTHTIPTAPLTEIVHHALNIPPQWYSYEKPVKYCA